MRTRAAIYCRVSSKGQEDNYSLASQEANCRKHVKPESTHAAKDPACSQSRTVLPLVAHLRYRRHQR
jgi:DNA invertase Pin-like site-specific DNA recombinase